MVLLPRGYCTGSLGRRIGGVRYKLHIHVLGRTGSALGYIGGANRAGNMH